MLITDGNYLLCVHRVDEINLHVHNFILLLHYRGLKSVVTDYIRPVVFGKIVPPIAQGLLLAVMVLTAAGLFQLIQNDIGVAKAVKRMWAIQGVESKSA